FPYTTLFRYLLINKYQDVFLRELFLLRKLKAFGQPFLPGFIQERTPLADRNLLHHIKRFSFTQTQTMRSHRDKYSLHIIRCDKSTLLNQGMRLCCALQGQKATRRKSMTAFTGFFRQIEQIFLNSFTDKYLMRQTLQIQNFIFSKNMRQTRNQGKTGFLL